MFSIYTLLDLIRCIILAYILYVALNRKFSVIIFVSIVGGLLIGLLGIPKHIYTFQLLQETYTSSHILNKVIHTGTGGLMFGTLAFVIRKFWKKEYKITKLLSFLCKIVCKPASLLITLTHYLAYGFKLWRVKYIEFLEKKNTQDKK